MSRAGINKKPKNSRVGGIVGLFWMISATLKTVNPPATLNCPFHSLWAVGILQPSRKNGAMASMKRTATKTSEYKKFFRDRSRSEKNKGKGTKGSATGLIATLMASKTA